MKFGICQLCQNGTELQDSHIFPRSYLKNIKGGNGQIFEITIDKDSLPILSNFDPKENLLCFKCEQFLSNRYELYGTNIFRKSRNIEKHNKYVKIKNFNYNKFYLFIISILWRASVSTLERYKHISFDDKINVMFAKCVLKETTRISSCIRLDHFFKIYIFRLKDFSNQLDDKTIRGMFFDLNLSKSENTDESPFYFYVIEGFLITIEFYACDDIHQLRVKKNANQMTNKTNLKIPFVDILGIKEIADSLAIASDKIVKYKEMKR